MTLKGGGAELSASQPGDSSEEENCYEKGLLCLSQEEWENAVISFSKAINLCPEKGQSLFQQMRHMEALEFFTRASELQPQNRHYRMRRCSFTFC
ncbi:tetratricopeptide repeat protein 16-like [Hyperolius riggenbachi]|uniref:tetratricopeptide repeat protein 16-like n=1 Tax=Hyperolius riggenbachi TaxID=752182 RepID=UPI0035A36262